MINRFLKFNSRTATPQELDACRRSVAGVPPDAEVIRREVDGIALDAVVYRWQWDMRQRQVIRIAAFCGKRTKADINEYSGNPHTAQRRIDGYFDGIAAHARYKAERQARMRQVDMTPYSIGAILRYSFGYDMTINCYYQIVGVKGQSVVLRKIAARTVDGDGGHSGRETPVQDAFLDNEPELTRRVTGNGVKIDHYHAHIWDGRPNYFNYMD